MLTNVQASAITKSPMNILYGSNAGTCEALAASLASTASNHGYGPKIMPLDNAVGKIPMGQPVIVIISSYEGEPPDNAAHFVEWLEGLGEKDLQGTHYAVFGCGNRKPSGLLFIFLLISSRRLGQYLS